MDDKQHPNHENKAPDAQKGASVRPTRVKRVMSKRWLYPAIYLGAAAVIIGLMYARSQLAASPATAQPVVSNTTSTSATVAPVTEPKEPFVWPVVDTSTTKVSVGFFPAKGSVSQQAAALVSYDNTYYPHKGIDIQAKDGSSFQVDAALSGKVTSVDKQPLYGQEIVVQSADGYTETYQSLGATKVKVGDSIHQGELLGDAATNVFEASEGNHLYLQIDLNGQPIDPESVLPKL